MSALLRLSTAFLLSPAALSAQVFGGGGLQQGIQAARDIQGVAQGDLRTTVERALNAVINMLGLLAAVSIVICGVMLIFSLGNEETAGRAKKGVMYSAIGLLVILFAKAIILFITQLG